LSQSEIMKSCERKCCHSASVITTQFFSSSSRCARSESFKRRSFIVLMSVFCGLESYNLSRRSAGAIEINHTVCLINSGKCLLSPLTRIVGSLVANSDADCHDVKVKNGRGIAPPKCFKSGGDFHPLDRLNSSHFPDGNFSPVQFYTPIECSIPGRIEIRKHFDHCLVKVEIRTDCPHDARLGCARSVASLECIFAPIGVHFKR